MCLGMSIYIYIHVYIYIYLCIYVIRRPSASRPSLLQRGPACGMQLEVIGTNEVPDTPEPVLGLVLVLGLVAGPVPGLVLGAD